MSATPDQSAPGALDVRVIGPDERDTRTGQTPGLQRFEAISARLTGSQRMGMGYAVLEWWQDRRPPPRESETAIYVISGVTRWWVGDRLDEVREAHAGDFVFIRPSSCTGSRTPATPIRWRWSWPAAPRRRSWSTSRTTRTPPSMLTRSSGQGHGY